MGWVEIKKAINSNLAKPLDKLIEERIDEVLTKALSTDIWTDTRAGNLDLLSNGTYGLSALRTLINTANSNILRGAVKSVQRGSAGEDSIASTYNNTRTISIATIDASKSIILISFENLPADSGDKIVSYGLSDSAISQSSYYYGQGRQYFCAFGYQVVEFY